LALGVGALLLGAPVAGAATVSAFPEPTYTATEGERNFLDVRIRPFGPSIVTFSRLEDGGAPVSDGDGAGTGCEPFMGDFDCPLTPGATVHVTLGDGADTAGNYLYDSPALSIAGGAGDDNLGGGSLADELLGDDGDDTITAWGGNDRLGGGAGDDMLDADAPERRDPNDAPGSDSVNGDAGDDWIDGRERDDVLLGDAGHDHVIGGDGADELSGGPGIDLIESIDGVADTVACGDGDDVVRADSLDTVASDCEAVSQSVVGARELRRDLRSDLRGITRALSRVSARGLAARRSIAHRFTPLSTGTVSVSWFLAGGTIGNTTMLGVRRSEAVGVRPTVVRLRLTRSARRRLRTADELQLIARAAFLSPDRAVRVAASARFTVTR
jgi:hypothetical protein